MSAVEVSAATAAEIELRLEPMPAYERLLIIQMTANRRSLRIQLYARSYPSGPMLAFAVCMTTEARLCYGGATISLWCDHTAFDVSEVEAKRIEETFAPHGLTVEREESAS